MSAEWRSRKLVCISPVARQFTGTVIGTNVADRRAAQVIAVDSSGQNDPVVVNDLFDSSIVKNNKAGQCNSGIRRLSPASVNSKCSSAIKNRT